MKTKLLIALWACYAMTAAGLTAGENETVSQYNDTIIIVPDSSVKIIFIGENMEGMSSYLRIDTVKTMLINDVQKAQSRPDYPASAKTTHYFISADGKRRLKAESQDYLEQEVNIEKESRSLSLGLPPYGYFIHDLKYGYEIQIYLSDPEKLKSLSTYDLGKAISLTGDKDVYKNNYRADLERRESEWILTNKNRLRSDMIEIVPSFGFGLIGNQWSPAVGIDMRLSLTNKYGVSAYRFGFSFLGYTFTHSNTMDFENLNFVYSYTGKIMFNLMSYEKSDRSAKWFGLTGGWMKSSEESQLKNRFKAGIIAEGFGPFSFAFDVIFLKDKNAVYGMTMLLPF